MMGSEHALGSGQAADIAPDKLSYWREAEQLLFFRPE